MLKVFLHETPEQSKEYNLRLLRHLAAKAGIPMVSDAASADVVWVSLCDIVELPILFKALKYDKPVLVGGCIAHTPCLKHIAEYVCEGEAYHLIDEWHKLKTVGDLANMPEITTRDKKGVQNEFIDYEKNPIVEVTNRSFYYYTGKGCPQRCKFCNMSYSREWQIAPEELFIRALRNIPDKKLLYPMTSHMAYKNIPASLLPKMGILDVRIRDYIKGGYTRTGNRIRAGIEFHSSAMRHNLAKPLTQDEINEFFAVTKKMEHESVLYFIGGLEPMEDVLAFIDALPRDIALRPRVSFVWTMFDAQPGTPMEDFDIRHKFELDRAQIFDHAQRVSRRIRTHPIKYIAHSTWRTLMQRADSAMEVRWVWERRNEKDNNKLIMETNATFPHLLGTSTMDMIFKRPRKPLGAQIGP